MKRALIHMAVFVAVLLAIPLGAPPANAQEGCQDIYEPNNGPEQAPFINGQIQATICPEGDLDIYKLNISPGEMVSFNLTNLTADYDMELYSGSSGTQISASSNASFSDEQITWINSTSDILYLVVYGFNGGNSLTPYTLNLTQTPGMLVDPAPPTADVSAQLRTDLPEMSDIDRENLIELLQYATDSAECIAAIRGWKALGTVIATPEAAMACGGVIDELTSLFQKTFVSPDSVGGGRAGLDLDAYCNYRYGGGAYSVVGDRWDAYSWSCYQSGQSVGGMDLIEACQIQHPDLPTVVMGDRWDAYSWYCTE